MALHPARTERKMVSSWYSNFSHPFYFDMLCQDSKRHRFQINLKPDLSTASLHDLYTSELFPHDRRSTFFQGYRICKDTLVSFWRYDAHYFGVYTGLMSPRLSNVISQSGPAAQMFLPDIGCEYTLFPCPASGRFVCLASNSIAVLDFF